MHALRRFAAGLLSSLAATGLAHAHLPSERSVRILVGSETVGLAIVVDGNCLAAFDDDGDGRFTRAEYESHRDEIPAWIDARVQLIDAEGAVVAASFSDMPIPDYANLSPQDAIPHIRIMRSYPSAPDRPASRLAIRLFDHEDGLIPYFVQGPERTASGHVGPGPALIQLSAR